MNRIDILQKILDRKKARTYLEIGVDRGECFFPLKAKRKIALDLSFHFSTRTKVKWVLKNPCNLLAKFYRMSSNEFFQKIKLPWRLDVSFIDGLHTYQQVLNDVQNVLLYLKSDGVIVLHDCNPGNALEAYPANSIQDAASLNLPGWDWYWCGDVWKAICYLRNFRKDLNVFVLDCDFGVGIITRGKPSECLNFSEDELNKMSFDYFEKNRNWLLNLKNENYLFEFLKTIE
ncbi:MAG: class I SAM-dependent methyltransferase [Candidatus Riflebacteria bacterium]|nr:class I SAM-dependent methyltransferase [Candidatus Riflebacteria bacterium]